MIAEDVILVRTQLRRFHQGDGEEIPKIIPHPGASHKRAATSRQWPMPALVRGFPVEYEQPCQIEDNERRKAGQEE